MGELKSPGKPFEIGKWEVWQAWEKVALPSTQDSGDRCVSGVSVRSG